MAGAAGRLLGVVSHGHWLRVSDLFRRALQLSRPNRSRILEHESATTTRAGPPDRRPRTARDQL